MVKTCIDLLEKFVLNGKLKDVFCDESMVLPLGRKSGISQYDPAVQLWWDELIRRTISLPDKACNVFQLHKRLFTNSLS